MSKLAESIGTMNELRDELVTVSKVRFVGISRLLTETVQQIYTLVIKPNAGPLFNHTVYIII